MSVLLEFAMFPTDVGESKSAYVGRIIDMIDQSGVSYQLTPMGTIIETQTLAEALAVVERAYAVLEHDCSRVYSSLKIDIRQGKNERLSGKIASVEASLGRSVKH